MAHFQIKLPGRFEVPVGHGVKGLPEAKRAELEVEHGTHRLYVEIVIAKLSARVEMVSAARLGETHDARADPEAARKIGNFAAEPLGEFRAFGAGPHKAHVAPQDIDQLWQFVKMVQAKHPPDGCRARVPPSGPDGPRRTLGALDHGAELHYVEYLSVPSQSGLEVKHPPAVLKTDRQRNRKG